MGDSLAVRYRPRRFADVVGQRHVSAVLRAAAARQAPPSQLLLAGGSGLGKTTLARIFAAALFCENQTPDGDACGVCESCVDVTGSRGLHPDVVELDAASNGGKDEIREMAARANLAPLRARWKVYIIDEAHGLTGAGGQAFLKLLEEPPAHTLFILATTDPDKLPTAVRGRCTICEVLPPTTAELEANLERIAAGEGWALSPAASSAVLAASDPALGLRGSVMTLEKLAGPLSAGTLTDDNLEQLLGSVTAQRLNSLSDAIEHGDREQALLLLDELSGVVGYAQLRRQLLGWARGRLLAAARTRVDVDLHYFRYETLVEAGAYEGALDVAVARCAQPSLSASTPALLAELTLVRTQLSELVQAGRAVVAAPGPSEATVQPELLRPAQPTRAHPPVESPRTPDEATDRDPVSVPVAKTTPASDLSTSNDPVLLTDAAFIALLNSVGQVSARAASVLRHCSLTRTGPMLHVYIPPALAARAAQAELAGVVLQLQTTGRLTDVEICP